MEHSKLTWEQLRDRNTQIGKLMGFQPTVEYCVGNEEASCYHPSHFPEYYPTPELQKQECIRWLDNHRERYPTSEVAQYSVVRREYYPDFHKDYNLLIACRNKLKAQNLHIEMTCNLEEDYENVWNAIYWHWNE